ncbi:O-antigen ligase domain-containing protein [Synechocystis sp. PCC 7339]|uniref:O-antigen ligase domain-containing protein n=1 Tax=unclassified Synechocystis TaxID=2640012 RepID=UPI001BB038A8|nr:MULTISPECIES: O-antigen ligase domain-containing protein [unclassified Synechocystis]QUS61640.1 O-antigen ligase domain-containing protein [Synechocystis sp. PCC 7338]UAJ73838.1 O-antigen ligase domain-containing protein [Synechocystis sp. PCC 7339]
MNDPIKPENFPERLVWYSMVYIYGFYLLGATYIVGSVLGVILGLYVGLKWWLQTEATPEAEKIKIHWLIWVWIISMAMMQVALVMGHLDFDLPTSTIIKSSIGWLKGWAALALYPLAGCLPIRPRLIYRAVCVICLQTLLISPLLIIAPLLHFPEILYVSPLKAVGGPGTTFFDVSFYEVDFDGSIRQRLFTPWGPALGFVANIYFVLALKEKNKKWRWFGIIGSLYLAQICKSRLAIVSLILTPIFTFCLARLSRPFTLMVLGIGSTITGIMAPWLFNLLDTIMRKFTEARSESSRVRTTLKQIAGYRWETEAPIWGHGIVESGPHVVEYMPIGSHHTWYGLLFVKGIVGFYALAIPMVLSLFLLLIKAQRYAVAEAGLAVLFILFLYTFGENLEILAYLYWPGLIIMGLGFYASGDRPDYQ